MKTRTNQSGSAHVVIIVVLILALLGVLGFVFWQNFVNKPAPESAQTVTTDTGDDADSSETKSITISEWGIKGSYSDVDDLSYQLRVPRGGGDELLEFTTPTIEADEYCRDGSTSVIFRYLDDTVTNLGPGSTGNPDITARDAYETMEVPNISWGAKAHIGSYYYFMNMPQSACTMDFDGPLALEVEDVLGATREFLLSAEAE